MNPPTKTRLSHQNADLSELEKFESLADKWWNLDGEFAALHRVNPLRSDYIDHRSGGVNQRRLLDIGCGGGILSEEMAARGALVTGIGLGEKPLAVAAEHAKSMRLSIDYQNTSAETLAEATANDPSKQFDVVSCMEMLEHVPEPASVVNAAAKLCRPGGHIFFATISRTPKAYALMIVGAEYLLNMVPKGTHDYEKFIAPAELNRWMRSAGLSMQDSTGVAYNPLNRRFRMTPHNLDVNYMLHATKL